MGNPSRRLSAIHVVVAAAISSGLAACNRTPPPPMPTYAEINSALLQSSDYPTHSSRFISATTNLIESGRCTLKEIQDQGGWLRSTNIPGNVYFTYCGGATSANRVYLDVDTGKVFH